MLAQIREEIIRHSLLGTGRTPLSETLTVLLDTFGIEEEEEVDQLLQVIATLHLLDKGARQWESWEGELPAAPADEDGRPCSRRSWQHLSAILEGHHAPALEEFLLIAGRNQRRLPPQALPAILDRCLTEPGLWLKLSPLLGPRAEWLLAQHPAWSTLRAEPVVTADWRTVPAQEQVAALQALRSLAPQEAREQLQEHWDQFDARQKAKLLPALEEALSPEDEAFLESCLRESRKEVRLAAAALLVQLPDSALVQRLFDHAVHCIRIDQDQLFLELPDEIPADSKRDGIYPTGSKAPGGLRLNWLKQLLARIPLQNWLDRWQIDATALIRVWSRSSDRSHLLGALAESLLLHPHPDGLAALLTYWMDRTEEEQWNNPTGKALLEQAPAALFNRLHIRWLEKNGALVPGDSLPSYWLQSGQQAWEHPLSKIIIQGFQDWASRSFGQNWQVYHYRGILETAAYRTDPALLDEFRQGWSAQAHKLGYWQSEMEKLWQTLHFRLLMRRELEGPTDQRSA